MDKIDLIIDALERANELWLTEPIGEQALAAARELKALDPVAWQGNGGAGYNVGGTALAQPEQEPVAWMTNSEHEYSLEYKFNWLKTPLHDIPLYTAPPKREWQGLTDDEIKEVYLSFVLTNNHGEPSRFVRLVEAKLKEKNSV